MEEPYLVRQKAFNNSEVEVEVEIVETVYRSVPSLEKSKSEELKPKELKVIRSYSY